jgi:hypothetical protein
MRLYEMDLAIALPHCRAGSVLRCVLIYHTDKRQVTVRRAAPYASIIGRVRLAAPRRS